MVLIGGKNAKVGLAARGRSRRCNRDHPRRVVFFVGIPRVRVKDDG